MFAADSRGVEKNSAAVRRLSLCLQAKPRETFCVEVNWTRLAESGAKRILLTKRITLQHACCRDRSTPGFAVVSVFSCRALKRAEVIPIDQRPTARRLVAAARRGRQCRGTLLKRHAATRLGAWPRTARWKEVRGEEEAQGLSPSHYDRAARGRRRSGCKNSSRRPYQARCRKVARTDERQDALSLADAA